MMFSFVMICAGIGTQEQGRLEWSSGKIRGIPQAGR